jgi:hypothetical protein
MLRYESGEWATPLRLFHKDIDYTLVFQDVPANVEIELNNLEGSSIAVDFSRTERPRTVSVPNQIPCITVTEEDETSKGEDYMHEQLNICEPADFDGKLIHLFKAVLQLSRSKLD